VRGTESYAAAVGLGGKDPTSHETSVVRWQEEESLRRNRGGGAFEESALERVGNREEGKTKQSPVSYLLLKTTRKGIPFPGEGL